MNKVDTKSRPRPTHSQGREPAQMNTHALYQNRYMVIGAILAVALTAFEIFNFDTTRYALTDLLGDIRFAGVSWAAILAVAFCGIDLAGLIRVFTPDEDENKSEMAYLMAAWLLGATMNAVMTWYAVSITLLSHNIGNEVVSREQLLFFVPLFVAVLVWLTRVLFIGAFSIAGEQMFQSNKKQRPQPKHLRPHTTRAIKPAVTAQPMQQPMQPLGVRREVEMPTATHNRYVQAERSSQHRIQAQ